MNISVDEHRCIELTEVFDPLALKGPGGDKFIVTMRDEGLNIKVIEFPTGYTVELGIGCNGIVETLSTN